jgi:hypothetical protein
MTKSNNTLLLSLLVSSTLFILPRTAVLAATDFGPMFYHSGSQISEVETRLDGASSDTFYTVNVFSSLQSFASIDAAIAHARGSSSEEEVLLTDWDLFYQFQSFINSMTSESESIDTPRPVWDPVRANMESYSIYMDRKQFITLQEMRVLEEKLACTVFSSTFTTTILERNGGDWLFSDAFDDDDDALDRAIGLDFEAAYQSTRFYYSVHYEPLLPLFDRIYDRCVGDKLAAFRRMQVK